LANILSADGKLLANIKFKDMLTNCALDSDENYLYVTGFSFVARIALKIFYLIINFNISVLTIKLF